MEAACGKYGLYLVGIDSHYRDSKIKMREIVRKRMAENLDCLASWDCQSKSQVVASLQAFFQRREATLEILGSEGGNDPRYDGVKIHYGNLKSKAEWKKAMEGSDCSNPRPIVFVTLEKQEIVNPGFHKGEFKKLECKAGRIDRTPDWTSYSNVKPVVANSIFLGVGKIPADRGYSCVPEFDTFLDWCGTRLEFHKDAIRATGRSGLTFDDVRERPLVVCEFGVEPDDRKSSDRLFGFVNTLNTIAFAEYVAEMFGTEFVHYQESLF